MTSRFKGVHVRPDLATRLFPHTHDRHVARLPAGQRFEVTWPAPLGPWTRGDVLERHVDLVGAHLPTLLRLGALRPTDKPAFKAPRTLANLAARQALTNWRGETLAAVREAGLPTTPGGEGMMTGPIHGAPSGKTITTG